MKLKYYLDTVINLNNEIPHMSIRNLTPNHIYQNNIKNRKLRKKYYIKSIIIVN